LLKKNKVATFTGIARLKTQDTIIVEKGFESQEIQAQAIVLATGSMPIELPFMKFDGNFIVSSTEALSFEKVPQHLIVVGGGAIGLELGSVWSRLGAKVSVVEMLPQIVPFADKQIATLLQRYLKSQGIEFYTNTKVTKAENNSTEVTIQDAEGKENKLTGDKVLVCVGRRPNSKFVGIDTVGIQTESSGRIIIQENFETNVKGIYAIGDLVAGPMLAHKAEEEGICVAEILAHKTPHINYNAIPNVVYTNPELAMVGITEEQAKEKKLEIRVGKSYFKGNGRALTMSESDGMVKIIADAKTDRVLGIHILGPRASDMIAQAALAFEFKASSEDIGRTIYAHPTLPEAIKEAALAITNQAIHG
jgi:dihydrolipoamide dehydrogenase